MEIEETNARFVDKQRKNAEKEHKCECANKSGAQNR